MAYEIRDKLYVLDDMGRSGQKRLPQAAGHDIFMNTTDTFASHILDSNNYL